MSEAANSSMEPHGTAGVTAACRGMAAGRTELLLWFLLAAAVGACFAPTFVWLHAKYSAADSYFSHGYLVPFVALFLAYRQRAALRACRVEGARTGLGVIIGALVLHLLSVLANVNFLSGFALVGFVGGCVLYLRGFEFTRRVSFPLFVLLFMCPLPIGVIDAVALPLKSISTSIALRALGALGVSHFREGFRILLPTGTFYVGAPCSGMHSLISFLALAALFAHITRGRAWHKALLVLCVLPLALFVNSCRILFLLLIGNAYGVEAASPESYLHDLSGIAVFAVGLAVMVLVARRIDVRDGA